MIRPAVPEDMTAMLRMSFEFFRESGWDKRADFDPESMVISLANMAQTGTLLVVDVDGKAVGLAAAGYSPAMFNQNLVFGQERLWYVEPTHRGKGGAGAELLEGLETAARAHNTQIFGMVAEHGVRSDALNRFYRARGYTPVEHTYCKVL